MTSRGGPHGEACEVNRRLGEEPAGRVLERRISTWPGGEPGVGARSACAQAIERRLGRQAADAVRPWLDELPLGRLGRVWSRLPYVEGAEALSNPEWTLEASPVGVVELARRAFAGSAKAGLLLELRSRRLGPPEPLVLYTAIPWAQHLREQGPFIATLSAAGWAVLECGSPRAAARLCGAVDSAVVRARRLGLRSDLPPSLL